MKFLSLLHFILRLDSIQKAVKRHVGEMGPMEMFDNFRSWRLAV